MTLRSLAALSMLSLVLAPSATGAQVPAKPVFKQDSLNVFRRFDPAIRGKMIDYYSKVLALPPLNTINLQGGQEVLLFRVGSGQVKLAPGDKEGRRYQLGGMNAGTGIRLYTFFFPDEVALTARFAAAGYPAPEFKDAGGGRRAAIVRDPGDFTLELVVVPNGGPETYGAVEVGINVTDLARSRTFYRDFAGLDALAPVKDAFLGVTKHPYRRGTTTINLWSVGRNLPKDTGSAGIQYVVGNVDAVDAAAKARGITIETPLAGVPGFNVKTVWLNDPDGATNYFYQFVGNRTAVAPSAPTAAPR